MRTLLLLRHAKADQGPTDFERTLSDIGLDQARRVAEHLVAENLVPDVLLCSAALRARQTWVQLRAGLEEAGVPVDPIELFEHDLYQASPTDVLRLVQRHSEGEVVLVIGHEPTMSMTAELIADTDSDDSVLHQVRIGVPTASLAVIDLSEQNASSGRLRALLRTSA